MDKIRSRDGTPIAYERFGDGPPLIVVTGAMGTRADGAQLASVLAPHFAAYAYDRRGRGDSGDTQPYSVAREIDDLDAVISAAGGKAFVFGHSSGAALVLEAALAGSAITRMALYEPPYIVNSDRPPLPADYVPTLQRFIAERKPVSAIEYFWRVGLLMPTDLIAQMRQMPMWQGLVEAAPTLPYDGLVMGDHMSGKPLPAEWARLTTPTVILDGGASPASLRDAVAALVGLLPNAHRRTIEGQGHGAPPEVVAPILEEFFLGRTIGVG